MSRNTDSGTSKVYVGDLPKDASERELERVFKEYGLIRNVWVARNPPGFAFIEFEDYRDADDAVKELDGTIVCGVRARVEHSSGRSRPKPWQRGNGGGSNSRDGRRYNSGGRRRRDSRSRSSSCRLPSSLVRSSTTT